MSSHHLKGVKKSSITDKIRSAICEYKKENPSVSQKELQAWVPQKYGLDISQSSISNTLKRASDYLSDEKKHSDVKKHKSAKYPELEKVLFEWFLQRQDKVNMFGEIIQEKGNELMKKMYGESNSDFSYSSGWLERFKARYEIKSYQRFGESGSVMMENIENALPGIRSKLDQFQLKDFYNMDETGLFYRLEADHSLATKQLEGHKKDKERIIVVVCCNGDGSDKVPLWITGKYANPRCFKNVNINNRNCVYRSNTKAWMTGLLFQEFVTWFDSKMNGRKILLIVDNCPAHPKIVEGLRNTKLFFLPPNTTSKIQPCDAGIIRAFKVHYRRRLYSSILQSLKADAINSEKINILNAIINVKTTTLISWNMDVKTTTIVNCFRHCKIRTEENDEQELGEINEGIEGLNEVISDLRYRNVMDVEHLLNYPSENDAVMESPTDEEIIESIMNTDDGLILNQTIAMSSQSCHKGSTSSNQHFEQLLVTTRAKHTKSHLCFT